jgi:hypothetical protein
MQPGMSDPGSANIVTGYEYEWPVTLEVLKRALEDGHSII